MTNQAQNSNYIKPKFDLIERTSTFASRVILFARKIPKDLVTSPIISQLVRSATSIGANYSEADDAQSRADFKHKIAICKKEARETIYWLKIVAVATSQNSEEAKLLSQEVKELNLIFNAIINKTNANSQTLKNDKLVRN